MNDEEGFKRFRQRQGLKKILKLRYYKCEQVGVQEGISPSISLFALDYVQMKILYLHSNMLGSINLHQNIKVGVRTHVILHVYQ